MLQIIAAVAFLLDGRRLPRTLPELYELHVSVAHGDTIASASAPYSSFEDCAEAVEYLAHKYAQSPVPVSLLCVPAPRTI